MLRIIGLALAIVTAAGVPAATPLGPAHGRESGGAAAAFTAEPDPQWGWPVDPPRSIVRQYIAPLTPYAPGHRGVDIRSPGATVYAPAAGIVHFAGVVVDRPVLSIEHPGGLISSYEPVETSLVGGESVAGGDTIGTVVSGHCSALCLHFGVRLNGNYVSPMRFLGGIPWSVLIPTRG